MTDDIRIPFRYSFQQTAFPASGPGARTGALRSVIANGEGRLSVTPTESAPVVAILDGNIGERLELRMVKDQLMRPVRRAGSFETTSVKEFIRAAHGEDSWRDSPFIRAPSDSYAAMSLKGRIAGERPGSVFVRFHDDGEQQGNLEECLVRLSSMTIIGDTVFMPCREPVLGVFMTAKGRAARIEVGWTIPRRTGARFFDEMLLSDLGNRDGFAEELKVDHFDWDDTAFEQHACPLTGRASVGNDKKVLRDGRTRGFYLNSDHHERTASIASFGLDRVDDANQMALIIARATKGKFEMTNPVTVVEPHLLKGYDSIGALLKLVEAAFRPLENVYYEHAGVRNIVHEAATTAIGDRTPENIRAALDPLAKWSGLASDFVARARHAPAVNGHVVAFNDGVPERLRNAKAVCELVPLALARWEGIESLRDLEGEYAADHEVDDDLSGLAP